MGSHRCAAIRPTVSRAPRVLPFSIEPALPRVVRPLLLQQYFRVRTSCSRLHLRIRNSLRYRCLLDHVRRALEASSLIGVSDKSLPKLEVVVTSMRVRSNF